MPVWEQFYDRLQADFNSQSNHSLLFGWLREEKERDFRLALRTRRKSLRDTPRSRREYGAFLVRALLEEPRFRPLQDSLEALPPLLACSPAPEAGEGTARRLRRLLAWLEGDQADPPRELLLALSGEVLERCPRSAERTDAYVELQGRFLDLELGGIGQADYLRSALDLLIRRERMPLDEASGAFLREYGLRAGGRDFFDGARRKEEQYRRLRRLLDRPDLPPVDTEGLAHLHGNLLTILLTAEARAFLYDSGRDAKGQPGRKRRKDRMMDLVDYCQENGLSMFQDQRAVPSEEEQAACEALYQSLRQSRNRRVLVPIRMDPMSGAGLYIMGADYFKRGFYPSAGEGGCCCYACFYLSDLEVGDITSFICYPDDNADQSGFPSLKEALSWYNKWCVPMAMDFYKDVNGTPPPNCPPALRCYFAIPGRASGGGLDLTPDPEDVSRIRAETDAEFEDSKKRAERRRRPPY